MRKRAQKLSAVPLGADNLEYFGLRLGQRITLNNTQKRGVVDGSPPQGPGVYVKWPSGRRELISGEDIREATIPSDG